MVISGFLLPSFSVLFEEDRHNM